MRLMPLLQGGGSLWEGGTAVRLMPLLQGGGSLWEGGARGCVRDLSQAPPPHAATHLGTGQLPGSAGDPQGRLLLRGDGLAVGVVLKQRLDDVRVALCVRG